MNPGCRRNRGFSISAAYRERHSASIQLQRCCHCYAALSIFNGTAAMLPHYAAEPFRQRFCRAAGCGARFFLCRACDRGQGYCSAFCRAQARTQQRRAARQRHQRSPAGRLDHRDRQRAYRRRLAVRRHAVITASSPTSVPAPPTPLKENVTDHASQAQPISGKVRASVWCWPTQAQTARTALGVLVCRWCGRVGRWLNPFVNTS